MIKLLQKKFIRIAMVTLTVAMVLVVVTVNIANWISVRGELNDTLALVSFGPAGALPVPGGAQEGGEPSGKQDGANAGEKFVKTTRTQDGNKAEDGGDQDFPRTPWEQRRDKALRSDRHFINMMAEANWFSAAVSADGEILSLNTDQIENLDDEAAADLVRQALKRGGESGFLHDYLYSVRDLRDGKVRVVMLNCETRLTTVRTLILISAIACVGAALLAWLLVTLASRKAVDPIIRNMEQQKQFITNASHELKTPLTVIATNMELLEMEKEDDPWVKSTLKQTAVMRRLVDELVYLSRMEEESPSLEMEPLDVGALLRETAEPFAAMAEFGGKEMRVETEGDLLITGDRASLQRMLSTLCDNAVKYASDGPILAEMKPEGKSHVLLRMSNPVAEPLDREQCEQLFNRFYRVDPSRNKEKKSGFGIGLAIAEAVAEKHGGRITAAMEGDRLVFTCLLGRKASGE